MSKFKPTEEQYNIFKYIVKRSENLLIKARAGSGKTFTLVQALRLIPKEKEVIFLAFNKHIKEELQTKVPEHVKCSTLHAVGTGAIKRKYGDSITFEQFKVDKLLRKFEKKWKLEFEFKNLVEKNKYLQDMKQFLNLCRLTLTLEEKYMPYIASTYDLKLGEKDFKRAMSVMEILLNNRSSFDYTDMVFLPAVDKKIFLSKKDVLFVDEAQDLCRAQQWMLLKMLKRNKVTKKITGRLISCGDDKQSIYSFAGSDINSFNWFEKQPNTVVLPLTTTFRCAKNIVTKAQTLVPDIKALEDAPDGIVRDGCVLTEPEDGDFVLCRTTTPLIKLFFKYLAEGKKAMIKGSDVGVSLIEMTTNYKSTAQLMGHWETELEKFKNDLRRSGILNPNDHSGFVALEDKVVALRFLCKMATNIPDLVSKIKQIFRDDIEGIVLSTVHKAKGLEADRVFIARPDKLPLNGMKGIQYQQELNLFYVAITRARVELIFDPEWNDEKEIDINNLTIE